LEDRSIDISQPEEQKGKQMRKNEQILRGLYDPVKHINICMMKVKNERYKGKRHL
jgi:hypothetical protein